jgi:hypothetical protein
MNDKPILMSTPMVEAYLAGKKTMTRRIVKLPSDKLMDKHNLPRFVPVAIYPDGGGNWIGWDNDVPERLGDGRIVSKAEFTKIAYPNGEGFKCPYQIGQKLWVKEGWAVGSASRDYPGRLEILYKTVHNDNNDRKWAKVDLDTWAKQANNNKWRSGRFMFKWASRITLEVTAVRVERLQEISEEDAIAEGTPINDIIPIRAAQLVGLSTVDYYELLWESINGKKNKWDNNPYVWVVSFIATTVDNPLCK